MRSLTLMTLLASLLAGLSSCSDRNAPTGNTGTTHPLNKNDAHDDENPASVPISRKDGAEHEGDVESSLDEMRSMETYKLIRFTPETKWYYPKSVDLGILADTKSYVDHANVNFSPDRSRIGGPIVDLPDHISYPDGMQFVAQLNLNEYSKHDPLGLLPKSGFLYFFIGGYGNEGAVYYADVKADDLIRVVKEHDKWFWDGCLVKTICQEEESFAERYSKADADSEGEAKFEWDYFAGTEKSKIYGIYTHCQKHEGTIKRITKSDKTLLLQIGSDFTDSGVWSVLIKTSDLKKRDFSNCTFEWGQS